jgi:transposase-like protein
METMAIDKAAREERRAAQREGVRRLERAGVLDELYEQIDAGQIEFDGPDGLIQQLIKTGLERGLQAELSDHLGYDKGDPAASEFPNSRNGSYPKTVATSVGDVDLDIPRDRAGTFTPCLVPKGSRRLGGLDDMIVSLYAGGMTVRDIEHHLLTTVGVELSRETISTIVDEISDEVMAWQRRALDPFYPVMYLDAIQIKIRDGAHVRNKAAHIALGVDLDGVKHVLGIWIQTTEGAKFWAAVCAELANRGVKDVLVICCDGLSGFPDAIAATWPETTIQTCVVHLIRAANRFVSFKDRKAVSAALRGVYTASDAEAARDALNEFEASDVGQRNPTAAKTFYDAWERFTPFLAFPPMLRRVIYTTNAIESLNYQLRKVTKNRGHFPNDEAAVKLLWLAICNIEDKRAREREKEAGRPRGQSRQALGRLVEGQVVTNWKQALAQLSIAYPDRIGRWL